jgi:hypothetical protein
MVRGPCIIQQYRDHSATFFKVYVIENEVMVYRRPSLPDLERYTALGSARWHLENLLPDSFPTSVKSIVFDSRFAYPTIENFFAVSTAPNISQLEQMAVETMCWPGGCCGL